MNYFSSNDKSLYDCGMFRNSNGILPLLPLWYSNIFEAIFQICSIEHLITGFIWILDSMGFWYSNGKVKWLGRPFKYQIIWQPDTNLPFEYQTSLVFRWLLDSSNIRMVSVFPNVTFGEEDRFDALTGSSVFAVEYSFPSKAAAAAAESWLSRTNTHRSFESISWLPALSFHYKMKRKINCTLRVIVVSIDLFLSHFC